MSTREHIANGDGNLHTLSIYEKEQDRLFDLLEEFQELAQPHLDIIEEQIFHLKNKAEAFDDLDLDDEIRESVEQFFPPKKEKTCENCVWYSYDSLMKDNYCGNIEGSFNQVPVEKNDGCNKWIKK